MAIAEMVITTTEETIPIATMGTTSGTRVTTLGTTDTTMATVEMLARVTNVTDTQMARTTSVNIPTSLGHCLKRLPPIETLLNCTLSKAFSFAINSNWLLANLL